MQPTEIQSTRPRVTVAALVERDGRFLFVEERDTEGKLVINQPAGHLEAGETVPEAVIREAFEETGWHIRPDYLVGCYLWRHPDQIITYLRLAIAGTPERHEPEAPLDEGIERAVWLSLDELAERRAMHRSPLIMRCVEDYLAGERYPLSVLKSLLA